MKKIRDLVYEMCVQLFWTGAYRNITVYACAVKITATAESKTMSMSMNVESREEKRIGFLFRKGSVHAVAEKFHFGILSCRSFYLCDFKKITDEAARYN